MLSPEQQTRLAQYREKNADGSLTIDELKEAVIMMREARLAAQAANAASGKVKKKAPTKSADDLLGELENL